MLSAIRVIGAGLLIGGRCFAEAAAQVPNWGIDACLTRHIDEPEIPGYIHLIKASRVGILREREVGQRQLDGTYSGDIRPRLRELKDAGVVVDAFATQGLALQVLRSGDQLPEDLRSVYKMGQALHNDFSGLVDVWEMGAEPDVGFCRDLPERFASYEKALYLGLKTGKGQAPEAMMGALALPPGPWLNRAVSNGLLEYTDAYNFHFYGHPTDLAGVLRAHRKVLERAGLPIDDFPIWITECGINAVRPGEFRDSERRKMQADFTVETAKEACAGEAAVFMPFILVHHGDPAALTLSADEPLPAWNAYAALTRSNSGRKRAIARREHRVNPVIMQWVPDEGSAIPHKVSGTYRFDGGQAMPGEIRIYNFGATSIRGRFEGEVGPAVSSTFPKACELVLAPGALVTLHGAFRPARAGYFENWWRGKFISSDGSNSALSFGLERTPEEKDFIESLLALSTPRGSRPATPMFGDYESSGSAGPWIGINGVKIEAATMSGALFRITEATGDPGGDPFRPPMAITSLHGLPQDGFLVVKPDRLMTGRMLVRIDLIDTVGQRFTIWENAGQDYAKPRKDLWLNLRDFHVYFWGRCTDEPAFHPGRIQEMQLRFYCSWVPAAIRVDFRLAQPKANPIF
ncbi:MAG TPA: hypothetical protein VG722_09835 [Tepidisphaeraceae bacterium]|nr:hypothetical protein [Tepidisphaeraceae bacterium]